MRSVQHTVKKTFSVMFYMLFRKKSRLCIFSRKSSKVKADTAICILKPKNNVMTLKIHAVGL